MSERDGEEGWLRRLPLGEICAVVVLWTDRPSSDLASGPVCAGHDNYEPSVGRVLRETLATLSRLSFVPLSFVPTVGRETTPER